MHVILDRVARRQNNPFGKVPAERERIAADTAEVEPLLRSVATVEINTCKPLVEVVDTAFTEQVFYEQFLLGSIVYQR